MKNSLMRVTDLIFFGSQSLILHLRANCDHSINIKSARGNVIVQAF